MPIKYASGDVKEVLNLEFREEAWADSVSFFFFLAVLGLRCCVRASHCGGFSCCRAWALGVQASVVVARGLSSCSMRAQ